MAKKKQNENETTPDVGVLTQTPLDDLIPTEDNPRDLRMDEAMRELIASVKAIGVLQPGVARPHPALKGKFDLRVGSRRLVASRDAGLPPE